jgi:hypothetical protein
MIQLGYRICERGSERLAGSRIAFQYDGFQQPVGSFQLGHAGFWMKTRGGGGEYKLEARAARVTEAAGARLARHGVPAADSLRVTLMMKLWVKGKSPQDALRNLCKAFDLVICSELYAVDGIEMQRLLGLLVMGCHLQYLHHGHVHHSPPKAPLPRPPFPP